MGQSVDPKILLSKLEGTAGIDSVPDGTNDSIVIEDDCEVTQDLKTVNRNNAKAYFGRDQELVYGKSTALKFTVESAGSGTAGVAPKWGKLLKACGFAESVLAAAHAGTAAAGAVGSITLAAGASAVDSAYKYMQLRITGGTGVGQTRVCKTYVGATKVFTPYRVFSPAPDATSVYSIDAQVVYNPTGIATSHSQYYYYSGKNHKLLMSRGSVGITQKAGEKRKFNFTFMGLYGGVIDATFPAATLAGWIDPVVVNFANTPKSEVHGYSSICYDANYDLACKTPYRNVPGAEDILFVDRDPSGSIEIEDPTVLAKDFPSIFNANTLGDILLQHGTVAGNIIGDYLPNVSLKDNGYGNQDGQVSKKMGMVITPTYGLGNDEVLIFSK